MFKQNTPLMRQLRSFHPPNIRSSRRSLYSVSWNCSLYILKAFFFCMRVPESFRRRRQRRQNNKTNYRRQKVHVNMWNKAHICAVLLSCETPITPFPTVVCKTWSIFQELTSIFSFRKRRLKQLKFSENRNKSLTKAKICSEKHNNCDEIFLLLTDVAVVVY